MPRLFSLTISIYPIPDDLDTIYKILFKLPCELENLSIQIDSDDKTYLDSTCWEKLITVIPNLKIFKFYYVEDLEDFHLSHYHKYIKNFITDFWKNRKCVLKILVDQNKISYMIDKQRYIFNDSSF